MLWVVATECFWAIPRTIGGQIVDQPRHDLGHVRIVIAFGIGPARRQVDQHLVFLRVRFSVPDQDRVDRAIVSAERAVANLKKR